MARARSRTSARLLLAGLTALLLVAPQAPASAGTLYFQPVWFEWEHSNLDVLILPPGHGQIFNGNGALGGGDVKELTPHDNSYLRAVEKSVADWDRAIATYGPEWLKNGLVTNVYVVGRDNVPQSALDDPEIIIAADETKTFILGVAIYMGGSDSQCIVDNSKLFIMSFTYEDMYNVNGQEYGHCLGLDHATGTPSDDVITHDVMHGTYYDPVSEAGNHRHCISNLNVEGLEHVFGPLFGQPGEPRVTMESTSYARMAC